MKISTRLLLLFLLVAVLPLLLFGYFSLKQAEATLREAKLSAMSNLADKKTTQVGSYLAERVQDVSLLVRGPRVMSSIAELPAAYAAGSRSAKYLREDALNRQYFARYVEELGIFYDVFLITPQGEIIYSQKHEADFASNLRTGSERDSQLAWAFRAVLMSLEPVVSGYEYYAPSQAPAMFIAAPIMDHGQFMGVFAVQLGNELFYRVATDATGLGLTGEVAFAQRDADGALYTAPLKYQADAAMKFRLSDRELAANPMANALSGDSGEGLKEDYRGKQVMAAWRYLPGLDWGMVVKIDADEVLAPIYEQKKQLLESLLGVLLLTGLAAYYFGRQISDPLNELAQISDGVSRGDMGRQADELAPGELGLFARSFNRMSDKLQAMYQSLEDRIEERTRELNVTNEQFQEEIIERIQIEKSLLEAKGELEQQQALLNEAQRLGQIGSWQLDLVSGELRWSDEIYRLFELDPARFTPSYENFLHAIHPEDRDKVNAAYNESLQTRQPYDVMHRLLMSDGRIKWVREHCISYFDDAGKPLRSVGAVQDITAHKLAEDNLRVAAAAFETHEGIMITDVCSNILRVNSAFSQITGYTQDEVLGKNPRILSSGRQDKAFYAEMWRQLKEGGAWSGEIWDRRKNGEIYPKWLTITSVKDAGGSVCEYVAVFNDITARKRAEEEIRNLAFFDALTGLPNRRLFLDRFHLAQSMSARSRQCGALLLLDMDKFKTLNDTLGHDYGDLMLVEVGRRIQASVRETDTAARLGGDEFVVLIDAISANMQDASKRVALIVDKIRTALVEPYVLKEHLVHGSPSIGVSMYQGNGESVDTLMKQADMAMYQAKDSGRNTVRFFDPVMQQAVEERARLEADLRGALPANQLQLYYQIQVDAEHRPIGAEALIRWQHPTRGMVPPGQFIPVAEESSLILDIGHWVIETACKQLAQWVVDERMSELKLAINVSGKQFRLSDFVMQLQASIDRHGVIPERLKLELTESVVLEDIADVAAKMHAIKALGVKLSLDDFGTGYSSLAYLKKLPLDQIKIDQSFVRDITTDPNDAVMVQTIIGLAQNFRMNVIAEGVETEAQLAFLKQNECMSFQGYLFGRPLPLEEFEVLARRLNQ